MRSAVVILSFLVMLAAGFWAYRENYATKLAVREANQLARQISGLQEAIAVQRAEWAYLNRPDRLAELAAANFERLGLMPMLPEQFADARQLPMPVPVEVPIFEDIAAVSERGHEEEARQP